jgi:hypothetical protein
MTSKALLLDEPKRYVLIRWTHSLIKKHFGSAVRMLYFKDSGMKFGDGALIRR